DMVGRTAAALVDLHVDLQPAGWRLVARAGHDERRAAARLEEDLDALIPFADLDRRFKVQLVGPWTLAAQLELPRGGKVLADRGALRDLAGSLAETGREHLAAVRRRLPHASVVLQLDEPQLSAVIGGKVASESGLSRLPVPEHADVVATLASVVTAAETPVVIHSCAVDVPVGVIADAGAMAVSLDLAVRRLDNDQVGELVERGLQLWLGVVPSLGPGSPPTVREILAPVRRLTGDIGVDAERLAKAVTLTPACGLAGASPGWARTAMRLATQSARALDENQVSGR
ncbi:MAG TPA: methionine synthase, partial [Mycobacteriales bacterium]|nr:methionine synthase [Mycobacteriales bacterium]